MRPPNEERVKPIVFCAHQRHAPGHMLGSCGFLRHQHWVYLPLLSVLYSSPTAVATEAQTNTSSTLQIYQRKLINFSQANFFKPAQEESPGLAFDLAPLLLHEVFLPGQSRSLTNPQFGRLCITDNVLSLDSSRPTIYVVVDTLNLNAKSHTRLSYLWFYRVEPRLAGEPVLPIQGVRLTLDATGKPAVWEVLTDASSAELIFVSESLEAAARNEYGPALAGRQFAIERSLNEPPKVVVARVIADGPLPMGPMIYLAAPTHAVSTLICRCMPAQARTLLLTSTYRLATIGSAEGDPLLNLARQRLKAKVSFWPGEQTTDKRLVRCLRLPRSF